MLSKSFHLCGSWVSKLWNVGETFPKGWCEMGIYLCKEINNPICQNDEFVEGFCSEWILAVDPILCNDRWADFSKMLENESFFCKYLLEWACFKWTFTILNFLYSAAVQSLKEFSRFATKYFMWWKKKVKYFSFFMFASLTLDCNLFAQLLSKAYIFSFLNICSLYT